MGIGLGLGLGLGLGPHVILMCVLLGLGVLNAVLALQWHNNNHDPQDAIESLTHPKQALIQNQRSRRKRRTRVSACRPPVHVIPMHLDDATGVYWLDLQLQTMHGQVAAAQQIQNTSSVSVALDTGSAHPLVNTRGCASCDAARGAVDVTSPSSHHDLTVVTYGSQEARVRIVDAHWCADSHCFDCAESMLMHSIKGSSNVQLLGVTTPAGASRPFVAPAWVAVLHQAPSHSGYFVPLTLQDMSARTSWVLPDAKHTALPFPSNDEWIEIVRPPATTRADCVWHTTTVTAMFAFGETDQEQKEAGGQSHHESLLPPGHARVYAMFDNGTAANYISPELSKLMPRSGTLCLRLRGGVTFELDAGHPYMVHNSSIPRDVMGYPGLLLGVTALRGHANWFDAARERFAVIPFD